MNKKNIKGNNSRVANDQENSNAGSAAFNQGVEQDPDFNDGTKVSDEEKRTGHRESGVGSQESGEGDARSESGEQSRE